MVGLVQKILCDMVESLAGLQAVEEMKRMAGVPADKVYRIGVVYSDAECQALFASARHVLRHLGDDEFTERYAEFFLSDARSRWAVWFTTAKNSRDFLEQQVAIHNIFASGLADPVERKAITDKFRLETFPAKIITHYRSPNRLCRLYVALAHWMARYYGDKLSIEEPLCMNRGDDECEIRVTWLNLENQDG